MSGPKVVKVDTLSTDDCRRIAVALDAFALILGRRLKPDDAARYTALADRVSAGAPAGYQLVRRSTDG